MPYIGYALIEVANALYLESVWQFFQQQSQWW
jgi:hypothetical protein